MKPSFPNAGFHQKNGDLSQPEPEGVEGRNDSKRSFLEAATRAFGDQAETRVAANVWLDEAVQADDAELDEAVKRWDEVDGNRRRPAWKAAFSGLVVVTSLLVGISCSEDTWNHLRSASVLINEDFSDQTGPRERILPKLAEPQKLLFPESGPGHRAWHGTEKLWKTRPENPACFAEYVRSFRNEEGHSPEAFLETARKLDADNAWFTYFAVDQAAKGALEQNRDESWKVLDQARFDRAVALFRESRTQTVCESYAAEMLALRIAALPSGNFPESLDGIMVLASAHKGMSVILMYVPSLVCAQSWMAAESQDVPKFREASQDAEKFLADISSIRVDTILHEMVTFGVAASVSARLSKDAERMGLSTEAGYWKGVRERLQENKKARVSGTFKLDGREADPLETTSILLDNNFNLAKVAKNPPALGRADLKPGWMVDNFFAARISGYAMWLVMVLCLAGAALYRMRVGGVPRGISRRAVDLLDRKDWAWILGAGVFLPFAYVMVVIFATPLGGHHSGLKGTGMLLPFGQFLGLCLLWVTTPVSIAGWRLGSRAAVLGFPKAGWMGWVAVAAAVSFVPMVGYAAISHSFAGFWREWLFKHYLEIVESSVFPIWFWIAFGLAAGLLLFVLGKALFAIFTRPERMISRAAVSRVLVPVFATALLVATLIIPVFQTYGQYWFLRDQLLESDPALPGWTGYEAKLAHQARKELREALGL